MEAIPGSNTYSVSMEKSNQTESVANSQSNLTFEERLAKWILDYLHHKGEVEGKLAELNFEMTENPMDDIASVIHSSTKDVLKMILSACREFVRCFRLTHHVSAIELGASEYRVLSETA